MKHIDRRKAALIAVLIGLLSWGIYELNEAGQMSDEDRANVAEAVAHNARPVPASQVKYTPVSPAERRRIDSKIGRDREMRSEESAPANAPAPAMDEDF